jgi:hypothetical protein
LPIPAFKLARIGPKIAGCEKHMILERNQHCTILVQTHCFDASRTASMKMH